MFIPYALIFCRRAFQGRFSASGDASYNKEGIFFSRNRLTPELSGFEIIGPIFTGSGEITHGFILKLEHIGRWQIIRPGREMSARVYTSS